MPTFLAQQPRTASQRHRPSRVRPPVGGQHPPLPRGLGMGGRHRALARPRSRSSAEASPASKKSENWIVGQPPRIPWCPQLGQRSPHWARSAPEGDAMVFYIGTPGGKARAAGALPMCRSEERDSFRPGERFWPWTRGKALIPTVLLVRTGSPRAVCLPAASTAGTGVAFVGAQTPFARAKQKRPCKVEFGTRAWPVCPATPLWLARGPLRPHMENGDAHDTS